MIGAAEGSHQSSVENSKPRITRSGGGEEKTKNTGQFISFTYVDELPPSSSTLRNVLDELAPSAPIKNPVQIDIHGISVILARKV